MTRQYTFTTPAILLLAALAGGCSDRAGGQDSDQDSNQTSNNNSVTATPASPVTAAAPATRRWYTQDHVTLGKTVFLEHCARCHGENAEGTPDWKQTLPDGNYPPPPLNGTAHAWHHPLSVLRSSIREGGIPLGGTMPAFAGKLNDDEIYAAIAYFQSKWRDDIYNAWEKRDGLR